MLLCCITLSSSREKPTQAQEVARRIFGAVVREYQVKNSLPPTCQFVAPGTILSEAYPSNCPNSSLAFTFLPLVFLSPTSEKQKFTKKYLPFSFAFFVCPFLSLVVCSFVWYSLLVLMARSTTSNDTPESEVLNFKQI